ncbi:MAG: hypothetical protein ACRDH9_03305 [Actinomycetota bacterium]
MQKRYLSLFAAVCMILGSGALAAAHHPEGSESHGWDDYDPVDGPRAHTGDKDQHGGPGDHLPPTSHNVDLVGKVELTDIEGGIADVGYYKGYAYLNAFSPECLGNGGGGTGVHVVDVSNPASPTEVGFLPAEENSYVGEGIHVITFQGRDILVHNNETCNSAEPVRSGVAIWDVTNPLTPVKLGQFGDPDPDPDGDPDEDFQKFHTVHSTQAFVWGGKAYFVAQDNNDLKDIDIFNMTPLITGAGDPVLVSEVGLEDWPGAMTTFANGDTVFHHDMQQKIINGHNYLLASYWDAGQVLLNIDDPASPVFVGDSDFIGPDPQSGFAIPEGNSHESYWSSNNKYILSTDEDFSPNRTLFELTSGPHAGPYGSGEFGFTPPVDSLPDGMLNGPTTFGGRGCFAAGPNAGPDAVGDPMPPPAPAAAPGEEQTVVFSRGGCFFSTKIAAGQDLGYDAVIIGQSHGGTRAGLLKDGFLCGGQGHDYSEEIPAICIGHRAMHLMFGDPEEYAGPEGGDIPVSTPGATYTAETVFDGWGYVNLHKATDPDLPIIDTYAIPEAFDESKADGFGNLTVHEVKTDPRPGINIAYFSYYSGGFRVAEFGAGGITEVGRFIDTGGNDFWGVFPVGDQLAGHGYEGSHPGIGNGVRPLVLLSDRDYGLYIFDYTGKKPKKD